MGMAMKEDDIFIPSFLDELNVRFAPPQRAAKSKQYFGGIHEMKALQKEFKIFKTGRSFATSARALHLSAYNNPAKNKWLDLLKWLETVDSNKRGLKGGPAIVAMLINDLERADKDLLPVYFTFHDGTDKKNQVVRIAEGKRPLSYMHVDYIVISLPTIPKKKR